jgi:hypothetical protein
MAIHFIDKETKDRSAPSPNTINKHPLEARMNIGTHAQQFNGGVSDNPAFIYSKDAKTLVNDGFNDRVILGQQVDGSYGLVVSKAGFNADPTDPAGLIFNSSQDVFKIVQVGQVTIDPFDALAGTTTTGQAMAVYDSDSDSSPIVLGFTILAASNGLYLWQGPSPESILSDPSTSPIGFDVYVGFNTIVAPGSIIDGRPQVEIDFNATVANSTGSDITGITYDIKYYILVETASQDV